MSGFRLYLKTLHLDLFQIKHATKRAASLIWDSWGNYVQDNFIQWIFHSFRYVNRNIDKLPTGLLVYLSKIHSISPWLLLITFDYSWINYCSPFCFSGYSLLCSKSQHFAYSVFIPFIRNREFFRLIEFSVAWFSLIHHFCFRTECFSDRVFGLFGYFWMSAIRLVALIIHIIKFIT